jgi:AcrR family transcriptional regulator
MTDKSYPECSAMPKETFFNLPDDKRQAILDLAIEEFAAHDYRNASISRIVERAGIAKGSFYQYFADKKDLYLYLVDMAMQEKRAFMSQTRMPQPDMDVFAFIRWLLRTGVDFQFSSPRLARIGYRALYDDAPLPEETQALIKQGSLAYFRELVAGGMARGEIDSALDPDVVAFVFAAVFSELGDYMLNRMMASAERMAEGDLSIMAAEESQSVFDAVLMILRRGMATPPGSA